MTNALHRTHPFHALALASREFDRLLRQQAGPRRTTDGVWGVPLNLYETEDGYLARLAVPGVSTDRIDVSVDGRDLSVTIRRPVVERPGRKVHAERPLGDVTRRLRLARAVDAAAVTAAAKDGVLEIRLPFAAAPRRIEVQSA